MFVEVNFVLHFCIVFRIISTKHSLTGKVFKLHYHEIAQQSNSNNIYLTLGCGKNELILVYVNKTAVLKLQVVKSCNQLN